MRLGFPYTQVLALILIAVIVAELAMWSDWTENFTLLGAVISALLTYAGLLSWVFLGEREAWPKRVFITGWRVFLSQPRQALISCLVLAILVGAGAVVLVTVWPVSLTGYITFDNRPINEKVTVTVRTGSGTSSFTSSAEFSVPLSRTDAKGKVYLSAESEHFRTVSDVEVESGTIVLPLARRQTLLVEVSNSGDPAFSPAGVTVFAREAVPEAAPQEQRTDAAGVAYFEAVKGSRWRVTISADKTYASPFFTVETIPFSFPADLSDTNRWTSEPRFASRAAAPLSITTIPTAYLKGLIGAGRQVTESDAPNIDSTLVSWAPQATRLLVRSSYMLSYNDQLKIPNWVAYVIMGNPAAYGKRNSYIRDPDLPREVAANPEDYGNSGYDRGGLVSRLDMSDNGEVAIKEAWYISMACPQTPALNRGVWSDIEQSARDALTNASKVFIFAGPAFLPPPSTSDPVTVPLIGQSQVAVPTHFFRIHVTMTEEKLNVIAFLVPNQLHLGQDIGSYRVSVGKIEEVTGLQFFASLSSEQQEGLKSGN